MFHKNEPCNQLAQNDLNKVVELELASLLGMKFGNPASERTENRPKMTPDALPAIPQVIGG